jgi:hypothetical protein
LGGTQRDEVFGRHNAILEVVELRLQVLRRIGRRMLAAVAQEDHAVHLRHPLGASGLIGVS